jgi:hypothetical protein
MNEIDPQTNLRAMTDERTEGTIELRSIADSIEPMFPSAAYTLRGIARQMEAAPLPAPEPT